MYTNDKIYTTERMTGGIKRFKMLYEGLLKKGYNVTLYCGETKTDLDIFNKEAYSINRDTKNSKLFKGISIFLKNKKLIKSLKKQNYDHVIVFDVPTAIGLCLNKLKNIDLFMRQDLIEYRKVMLQEKKKNKLYTTIYLKFMNYCEYICCKRAKKIVVQCQYDLNNLLKRHKHISSDIKNKTSIQINNVNAPWIVDRSNKEIENIIEKGNEFQLCFVGDFSSTRKGHDIFLNAINNLIQEKLNIKAYLVGDGKLLEHEKEKYNDKHIVFLGRLTNPIDIIKQSDLVIVPSRADSCPNTVLESLYNHILVFGSNAGGIPEILNDEEMLFELNEKSLEKMIKQVYNNRRIYDRLLEKQKIRERELEFDWIKAIVRIIGVNDEGKN